MERELPVLGLSNRIDVQVHRKLMAEERVFAARMRDLTAATACELCGVHKAGH